MGGNSSGGDSSSRTSYIGGNSIMEGLAGMFMDDAAQKRAQQNLLFGGPGYAGAFQQSPQYYNFQQRIPPSATTNNMTAGGAGPAAQMDQQQAPAHASQSASPASRDMLYGGAGVLGGAETTMAATNQGGNDGNDGKTTGNTSGFGGMNASLPTGGQGNNWDAWNARLTGPQSAPTGGLYGKYQDWANQARTGEEYDYYENIKNQFGPSESERNTRGIWDWNMSGQPTGGEADVLAAYGKYGDETPDERKLKDTIGWIAGGNTNDRENNVLNSYKTLSDGTKTYDGEQGSAMGWLRSGQPTSWEDQVLRTGTSIAQGMSPEERNALTLQADKTASSGYEKARQDVQRRALATGNSAGAYGAIANLGADQTANSAQRARQDVLDIGNENVRRGQIGAGILGDQAAKQRGYTIQGMNLFKDYDTQANANKLAGIEGQAGYTMGLRNSAQQALGQGQNFVNAANAKTLAGIQGQQGQLGLLRGYQQAGAQGAQAWDAQQRANNATNMAQRNQWIQQGRQLEQQGVAGQQGLYSANDPGGSMGAAAGVYRTPYATQGTGNSNSLGFSI